MQCSELSTASCPLDMVDVVRLFRHGGESSWTVCRPFSVLGRPLRWMVLPPSLDTSLVLSVSAFGDLRSYSQLSQVSCFHRRHLAASLHLLGVTANRLDDVRSRRACHICGALGLACGFAGACGNCDRVTCADCVALASFSRKRRIDVLGTARDCGAVTWICVHCVGDDVYPLDCDFPTVMSLKTEVVDAAWDVANGVIGDYDLPFWLRLVCLSGEEVRDEQRRSVGMVYTRWNTHFESLWRSVYFATGGRILQLVIGGSVVDRTSLGSARWSRFLSRSQAESYTDLSPLAVTVVLRGWH